MKVVGVVVAEATLIEAKMEKVKMSTRSKKKRQMHSSN